MRKMEKIRLRKLLRPMRFLLSLPLSHWGTEKTIAGVKLKRPDSRAFVHFLAGLVDNIVA